MPVQPSVFKCSRAYPAAVLVTKPQERLLPIGCNAMIRVGYEGNWCFVESPITVRGCMKRVKTEWGIPCGQQEMHFEGVRLPPKQMLVGDATLMMTRKPSICGYCDQRDTDRKLRLCSGCLDERYCDDVCQRKHWKSHKRLCRP